MSDVGQALGQFYGEWGRQLDIMVDRSQSFAVRLAAMQWIDKQTGESSPPDDLEMITDQILADR